MMVSHQVSVPTVASVTIGKKTQTAATDTLQGHVRHLMEQMSSLVDRLDGLSIAVVARRLNHLMVGLSSGVSSVIKRATFQGTVASNR